jgi:hypothetical protein
MSAPFSYTSCLSDPARVGVFSAGHTRDCTRSAPELNPRQGFETRFQNRQIDRKHGAVVAPPCILSISSQQSNSPKPGTPTQEAPEIIATSQHRLTTEADLWIWTSLPKYKLPAVRLVGPLRYSTTTFTLTPHRCSQARASCFPDLNDCIHSYAKLGNLLRFQSFFNGCCSLTTHEATWNMSYMCRGASGHAAGIFALQNMPSPYQVAVAPRGPPYDLLQQVRMLKVVTRPERPSGKLEQITLRP